MTLCVKDSEVDTATAAAVAVGHWFHLDPDWIAASDPSIEYAVGGDSVAGGVKPSGYRWCRDGVAAGMEADTDHRYRVLPPNGEPGTM